LRKQLKAAIEDGQFEIYDCRIISSPVN